MFGYLNNKKGFVVSRGTTKDTAYVVDDSWCDGRILVYQKQTSDVNYTYKGTLYPVIPYRFILCDPDAIKCVSSVDGDLISLFNPGLSCDGSYIQGLPNLLDTSCKFVEINLTQNQAKKLLHSKDYVVQKDSNRSFVYAAADQYSIGRVTNMSLVVKNIDTNTDCLIISMLSTVRYVIRQENPNRYTFASYFLPIISTLYSPTYAHAHYSIPVILIYDIVHSNINYNTRIVPRAWTYGFPSECLSELHSGMGKINPSLDSPLGGFNYNYIAGDNIATPTATSWFPGDLGSLIDSCTNGTDLFIISCISSKNPGKWLNKLYLFKIDDVFSQDTSGFLSSTTTYFKTFNTFSFGSFISSCYNNNCVLAGLSMSDSGKPSTILFAANVDGSKSEIITVSHSSSVDIEAYNDGFVLGLINTTSKSYQVLSTDSGSSLPYKFNNRYINCDLLSEYGFSTLYTVDNMTTAKAESTLTSYYTNTKYNELGISITSSEAITSQNPAITNSSDFCFLYSFPSQPPITAIFKYAKNYVVFRFANGNALDSVRQKLLSSSTTSTYAVMNIDSKAIYDCKNSDIKFGTTGEIFFKNSDGSNAKVLVQIDNCSGIFRDSVGVQIDPFKTRMDLQFSYYGTKNIYDTTCGSCGYWAVLVKPDVESVLTYNDKKIGESKLLHFVEYDVNGLFKTHIPVELNLSNVFDDENRSYADDGYTLNNISIQTKIYVQNTIIHKVNGLSFSPPSRSISIVPNVSKYLKGSVTLTATKTNALSRIKDGSLNIIQGTMVDNSTSYGMGNFASKINELSTTATAIHNITPLSAKKGSYFYITWVEEIGGRNLSNATQKIPVVGGHRYIFDNTSSYPKIYLNSVDKTDDIFNSSDPYLYLDPAGGMVSIKVEFSVIHENFSTIDGLTDAQRYPVISQISLLVVPYVGGFPRQILRGKVLYVDFSMVLEEDVPQGAPLTYPNGTNSFASYLSYIAAFSGSKSYGGSTTSKTDSITIDVNKSGRYHLFLIVKDEYDQCSVFHITSKNRYNGKKTYRTEFIRG